MDRIVSIQNIRKKLKNNSYSIGSFMQIPHSSIAELMGMAQYDWIAVDLEHGSFSLHQLPDIFRALELGNTLPLARLAQGTSKSCKQALDAGAGGVIIPMIETAVQAQNLRNACCWPPEGLRGVGFSRANLFGKSFEPYQTEAQAPLFIVMIEHIHAVNNLPDILAVEGLDALFIGPYDLSASMGLIAQFDHPKFQAVLQNILEQAQSAGIPCGIHVVQPVPEVLYEKINQGYQFLAYATDALFLNAVNENPCRFYSAGK